MARRIGYTGTLETHLAIYRLRVKPDYTHTEVTISGFFVREKGIFRVYEPKLEHKPVRVHKAQAK